MIIATVNIQYRFGGDRDGCAPTARGGSSGTLAPACPLQFSTTA